MEHIGSEYIVMFNDPQLRQGLIREANRSRRSGLATNSTHALRQWFANALHGLAAHAINNRSESCADLLPIAQGTQRGHSTSTTDSAHQRHATNEVIFTQ